jgi:5-methylcytosine-specific restriction endonuclease McrA
VAAIGDLLIVCAIGFVLVAALSLMLAKTPATPPFARRAATSGSPQLRQDPNASFLYDRGFLFRRRIWFVGTCCPPLRIDAAHYGHFSAVQRQHPVVVARSGPRVWWWLEDSFYWESGSYTQRDVLALVRDRQRRDAQRMDRAHMMLNVDEGHQQRPQGQRQPILREVRRAVFERDGGQCAECSSKFDLQYDHVIPVALGGATTVGNLQLLCGECNRLKGADL